MAILRAVPALVLLGLLMLAAPAQAAAGFLVTKVELLDDDEDELRIVPREGVVTIRATLNNTGNETFNGTLAVTFVVRPANGSVNWTGTVRRNVVVAAGNTTTFEYRWSTSARVVGNNSVTMTVEGFPPSVTAYFEVRETAVPAGTLPERFLQHYWFFGVFLLSVVLFFAAMAARKG